MDITVIILTYNSEKTLPNLLDKLDFNKYRVLIVDSSSVDLTIQIANDYKCNTHIINQSDFNHGATRELSRKLYRSDISVFFTDDSVPFNNQTVDELVKPIISGEVSISYARQIPRENAKTLESFHRYFNYRKKPQIRSISDVNNHGVYTFFCSNSCAAWSNKALDEIGGFKPTLTNEDYFACAKLLINGNKVAYVPESIVIHSHKYFLLEEFQRMFDTGYVRAERPWIQDVVGSADKRGIIYFINIIKKLLLYRPWLIPYALVQFALKYLGYKIGFHSLKFPRWLKKLCSAQKYYWNSKYYKANY